MNTGGSGSFLDYCKVIVGFIGGVTIAGLGLVFRVLVFGDGIRF